MKTSNKLMQLRLSDGSKTKAKKNKRKEKSRREWVPKI
jgi:hypothetical protein